MMNPHNKSFLLGFLAGCVVMLTLVAIWNLSIPHEVTEKNLTINETPHENPIAKILNEPHENPFKNITAPDITKYFKKLLILLFIGFIAFYIFFAVNSQTR